MKIIIQIVAAVCMITGSTGLGCYLSYDYKRSIKELQYINQILEMLKQEIAYSRIPFSEACNQIARRVKEPYKEFLTSIHVRMVNHKGETIRTVWKDSIQMLQKAIYLPRNTLEYLEEVVDESGFMDGQMQLQKITFQIERIENEIQKRRKHQENKSRIYLSIGIMSGILGTIIFI